MRQTYRRRKKGTVQLTSLLDLLFVMIFVSLMNQKKPTDVEKTKSEPPKVAAVKPKATPKPVPTVKPKAKPIKKTPPVERTYYNINATFKFYASDKNPNLPSGSYRMHGGFTSKSGRLELGGVSWIKRPPNYDMVPLAGSMNKDRSQFRGRIEFQGCKEFTLKRVQKMSATPISGIWEGRYSCGQGETGLTLTIK